MYVNIIIICIFVFLAGFVDAIAGGGGLISLPAYLFVGLPVHNAIATNKFSAACGTTFSMLTFSKHKALDWKVAVISAVASFIASFLGSSLALVIDEAILKKIILIALPLVACFILFKRDKYEHNNTQIQHTYTTYLQAFLVGAVIGFYDGLIGPGTGTFAILAYSFFMHYDLVTASGNAKVLNVSSNYASVVTFLLSGKIMFSIGIPAAMCGIFGNYIGASLAIKKGGYFIKIIMLVVIITLFIKILVQGL